MVTFLQFSEPSFWIWLVVQVVSRRLNLGGWGNCTVSKILPGFCLLKVQCRVSNAKECFAAHLGLAFLRVFFKGKFISLNHFSVTVLNQCSSTSLLKATVRLLQPHRTCVSQGCNPEVPRKGISKDRARIIYHLTIFLNKKKLEGAVLNR